MILKIDATIRILQLRICMKVCKNVNMEGFRRAGHILCIPYHNYGTPNLS